MDIRTLGQTKAEEYEERNRVLAEEQLLSEIAEIIATGQVRRRNCTCEVWRHGMSGVCPDCTAKKILTLIQSKTSH